MSMAPFHDQVPLGPNDILIIERQHAEVWLLELTRAPMPRSLWSRIWLAACCHRIGRCCLLLGRGVKRSPFVCQEGAPLPACTCDVSSISHDKLSLPPSTFFRTCTTCTDCSLTMSTSEDNMKDKKSTRKIPAAGTSSAGLTGLQSEKSIERLEQISSLRARGISKNIDLPQLVVCGDQSAGKSSVLEGISNIPFPRADGVCTKVSNDYNDQRRSRA